MPREKSFPLIWKNTSSFLQYCCMKSAVLDSSSSRQPKFCYDPEKAVLLPCNCTRNFCRQLVCRLPICPSGLWSIRPRAHKQLRFVCLKTDIESVLVLFMKVRNTTTLWKAETKKVSRKQGQMYFFVWANAVLAVFIKTQIFSCKIFVLYLFKYKRINISH